MLNLTEGEELKLHVEWQSYTKAQYKLNEECLNCDSCKATLIEPKNENVLCEMSRVISLFIMMT